jgi:hypothetical protein
VRPAARAGGLASCARPSWEATHWKLGDGAVKCQQCHQRAVTTVPEALCTFHAELWFRELVACGAVLASLSRQQDIPEDQKRQMVRELERLAGVA